MIEKKIEEDPRIRDFIKISSVAMKKFIEWGYREKEDYFQYLKIISMVGKNSENLEKLFIIKSENKFLILTYLTLISWNMDQRKAHLEFFDTYEQRILENLPKFIELKNYNLNNISDLELPEIKNMLKVLYNNLDLMISNGRIVSNSKIMHFLLPNLILPIDNNTLSYLGEKDSVDSFLRIFEFSWKIVKVLDLSKYLGKIKWNTTIPKIIDNIILSIMRERGKKQYFYKRLEKFKKNILNGKKNTEKHRIEENKYAAIPTNILQEIIDEIKNEGTKYFNLKLIEIEEF